MGRRSSFNAAYDGKSVDEQLPPVVVGGLSALSISGLSQYLSLGSTPHIHLYATKKLPSWLTRLSLGHSISKLWPDSLSNIRQQHHHWCSTTSYPRFFVAKKFVA
ncbi:hypothetical protein [Proteus mirabilis]|uniref:hypothetical protein n=1 Tax=Proteus mirabilis TaxID=584 RepID=UPI001F034142|nr:hypothetical protein [Proteus mirabilis]MCY9776452.1 hypothetical protein [Proteus mirabilis]MCY9778971.1 hypothetical protein [Proteus mirabilis]MCY9790117.1 hypothetical protein [Proteus mirabilis]WFC28026.1 hypothetical protein PT008_16145 [Proteus mirabilis]